MAAVSTETIGKALNLSARRVQQLVKEGLPRIAPGQFDLGLCMQWYIRYLQQALEARATPGGDGAYLELSSERARLAREQADRTALENATRRGELVEVAVAAEEWSRYLVAIRARFLALPTKLAAEIARLTDADAVRSRIDNEVRECLAAAADQSGPAATDAAPAAAQGRERTAAAAKVNGQRVGRRKAPAQPGKLRRTRPVAH